MQRAALRKPDLKLRAGEHSLGVGLEYGDALRYFPTNSTVLCIEGWVMVLPIASSGV